MNFQEFEIDLLDNGWTQSNTMLKTSGNTRLIQFDKDRRYVSVIQQHDGSYVIVAGIDGNTQVASSTTSFKDFFEKYGK